MKINPLKPTWKISEKLILENFEFLQSEFNFPKFKKEKIRYEYYISTQKNGIEFSCLIFQLSPTSPEIGIFDRTNNGGKKSDFYKVDSLDKTGKMKKTAELGREYIEFYIRNCAELLRKNSSILEGNLIEFKIE